MQSSVIGYLIKEFSHFPGVGPKMAERFVYYLLEQDSNKLNNLSRALSVLKNNIVVCQECFCYAQKSPCNICSDPLRNKKIICVIADTRDMLNIEKTKQFKGVYFSVGKTLNVIEGIEPDDINTQGLIAKIQKTNPTEIVLALSSTIEGETTAMYLTKVLSHLKLKITKLARGLQAGTSLENVDEMTMANAFRYRREV